MRNSLSRPNSIFKLALALFLGLLAIGSFSGQAEDPKQQLEKQQPEEMSIRAALEAQTSAWNRGDIPGFMGTYEDSPDTTFVGANSIDKGYAKLLERYKKGYSTRQQMGKLTFSELTVRLLPGASGTAEYAVVTGHFHLERKVKGEGTKDDGIFSLVWHKGTNGWKILLDHTA